MANAQFNVYKKIDGQFTVILLRLVLNEFTVKGINSANAQFNVYKKIDGHFN